VASLAAVAALLPFERLGAFEAAGISVRPSQIALIVTILVAGRLVWHRRLDASLAPQKTTLAWLAAFFAVAALSMVGAENFSRSLAVLAFTAFTASLAFLMPIVLRDRSHLALIRNVVLWSAVAVGAFGLWQFLADMAGAPTWMTGLRSTYSKSILGFSRVQGASLEPLYFANYLLLPISLAAAWLLSGTDRKKTIWLAGLLGLLCADLLLTSSRGGYAGLAVSILISAWQYRQRVVASKRLVGTACVIIAAAFMMAWMMLSGFETGTRTSVAETFWRHVSNVQGGAAYDERLETFSRAVEAFKTRPWIGVGIGGYGPFSARFSHLRPDTGWAIANNQPLELLAETGILGFTAFVLFLCFLIFKNQRARQIDGTDAIRVGALAALVGMIVQYQTFSTLYIMHVWFTIGLVMTARNFNKT
jgi:O-antigen ligase